MAQLNAWRPVDLDFFETAVLAATAGVAIRCSAERVMEMIRGDRIWTRWVPVLVNAEWMSEPPRGLGSQRRFHFRGGYILDEISFHWIENERVCSYVEKGTMPGITAFAEDFRIGRLGKEELRFSWTIAVDVEGWGRTIAPLSRRLMRILMSHGLRKFKRICESAAVGS